MRKLIWIFFISLGPMLPACGVGSSNSSDSATEVDQFLAGLPGWNEFAPNEKTVAATPTDDEPVLDAPVTLSTPVKSEDGDVERDPVSGEPLAYHDVTYTCTNTQYSLTDTPEKIVMYNPDASILWPGSLIEGESHRNNTGSLRGLTIAQRAPIQIAITDFLNDNPAKFVDNPSLVTVTQAIGDIVGDAEAQGLDSPSSILFNIETYHSESEFAAKFNISGKYLGFDASARGEKNKNVSENTIAVNFYQQMFTVSVAPPQTPGSFFTEDFDSARLKEQTNLGKIGPNNLPVYLSEVVYGRMMMFTMTSTASEEEMEGTINAAYNGIGTSGSGGLSASQKKILDKSKIVFTSYGGSADATLAIIRSGDWSQYFTKNAALTSAKPMSYVFRNLGDGSIAKVSEAHKYNVKECAARLSTPGTFDFTLVQKTKAFPIKAPYASLVADVNGDEKDDLILNHRGDENELMVALGQADGSFRFTDAQTHPDNPGEGWGSYQARLVDVNNDEKEDIIWNSLQYDASTGSGFNRTYVALSKGDGSFEFITVQDRPETDNWSAGFDLLVGDMNGDEYDDLIWNLTTNGLNRTYISLSQGNGMFTHNLEFQDHEYTGDWSTYTPFIGNVNHDIFDDLIWHGGGASHRFYTALSDAEATLDLVDNHSDYNGYGLINSVPLIANVDSDRINDFIWTGLEANHCDAQVGNGRGVDSDYAISSVISANVTETVCALKSTYVADVNGDGRDDVIWIGPAGMPANENIKNVIVGLGTDSDLTPFDFTRVDQDHPQVLNWSSYDTVVGDVNGDGLDDIIWIRAEGNINRILIGIAKNED